MKKNITIFLSFIFLITISFVSFSNDVKAYEFTYKDVVFDTDTILSKIKTSYPNPDYDNTYTINIAYASGNTVTFVVSKLSNYTSVFDINMENRITDTSIDIVENDNYIYSVASNNYITYYTSSYYYRYNVSTGVETIGSAINNPSGIGTNLIIPAYNAGTYGTYEEYLNSVFLYSNVNINTYYIETAEDGNTYLTKQYREYDSEIFDKTYSTSEYSKVEFIFNDFSSFEYDYFTFFYDFVVNAVVPENTSGFSFTAPYIEWTKSDGSKRIETLFELSNYYYEHASAEVLYKGNVESIKLVIPLDSLTANINIKLDVNMPYELIEYTKDEFEYVYDSIDLTGKAGVLFVPKQIDDDMYMTFKFYPSNYSMQLRDTYKENFNVLAYYSIGYCDDRNYIEDIPYICNNGTDYFVSIMFEKGNSEQSLFVVNRDYPSNDKSVVYYDSRYFDAIVYDTFDSKPIFTHPITGEETIGNTLLDFDSSITEQKTFFDSFKLAFENFQGVIKEIFENVSYFYDNMPVDLRYFFISVFSLIIFTFLIRFLL